MSKEKKKQASVSELRNGSFLFLLFSPIILLAFVMSFLLASIVLLNFLSVFFLPPEETEVMGSGALIFVGLFVFMTYVLLRYVVRWRQLALFIKRVRDEYFRFVRMQENVAETEVAVEELYSDDDIDYHAYEDEQQRGLSQR